jgi:hypothetical protein
MDLSIVPDIYEPVIDEKSNYIDCIPQTNKFKNGMRCPCGTRREHIFDNRPSFVSHIKSKTHQKWLSELNLNKMNYFSENLRLNETVNNQKIIIAKLQRDKDELLQLTESIKKQVCNVNTFVTTDLINFD